MVVGTHARLFVWRGWGWGGVEVGVDLGYRIILNIGLVVRVVCSP